MKPLLARLRVLVNDPGGTSQIFDDQTIQDVMDESRFDANYLALTPFPTYSGATIQYLDYYSDDYGNWEDNAVFKQYRTLIVTPSSSENIVGHWTFAQSTLPPVFIIGASHDIYRAAADLLEREAARWTLSYDMMVDGQSLKRSQAAPALQALAHTYRMKQRPTSISVIRSDLAGAAQGAGLNLGPRDLDYYAQG